MFLFSRLASAVCSITAQPDHQKFLNPICRVILYVGLLLLCWSSAVAVGQEAAESSSRQSGSGSHTDQSAGKRVSFARAPISFEPNEGQFSSPARFISRGGGYLLELEPTRAVVTLQGRGADQNARSAEEDETQFTLGLAGANSGTAISGDGLLPGVHHYLDLAKPGESHTDIPTFRTVTYREIYPGVNLSFYGNADRLEYDFHVRPHSDPAKLQFFLGDMDRSAMDEEGNLILMRGGRSLRILKPVAYQLDEEGRRRPVDARFQLSAASGTERGRLLNFALGSYDHGRELVIDPVLDYSLFLPAAVNGYLYVGASTTDSAGNTYITGTYPITGRTAGAYQAGLFVAEFNSAGQELFTTTFGTSRSPNFQGTVDAIALGAGKIYIGGEVSGAYGGALQYTSNAYLTTAPSAYTNGFLSVISADGKTLTYSTYFGGNGQINSIAVDSSGNAYVAGTLGTGAGTVLPVTANAPVQTAPGQYSSGFLAKINPNASGAASLVYSTFIGAPQSYTSVATAVAVDKSGNAYVTGNAQGSLYPVTAGAYQYNGRDPLNDVFVSKVNATGTGFVYSTLLGPGKGTALQVDGSGDAYIAGTVKEDDFPTTGNAYQITYPSGFVTELNPAGTALIYSTFLGGQEDLFDTGTSYVVPANLAIPSGCSSACSVYVAGYTNGSDFPLIDQIESFIPGSPNSAFYVQLSGDGSQALQSSYFASGNGFDPYQNVPGIGVDSAANIYLTGDVLNSSFPVSKTTTAFGEGFLAKIGPAASPALFAVPRSIQFPTQIVGVSTAQQGLAQPTVLLENLGTEAATLSSITVSPSNLFSATNDCNGKVPAGGHCTLTLGFTPGAVSSNPQAGSIVVASNANPNPTIQLTGSGQDSRYVIASCGASPCPGLTFPDVAVGSASSTQIVTLVNRGDVAAPLPTISSSLPDYLLLNNCPQTGSGLAAHASCQISVLFRPTQVGLRSGVVNIVATGTAANPIALPVTGTGLLSPNASSIAVLDPLLNFGTETEGLATAVQLVTVVNNGGTPVTIFQATATTSGDASGTTDFVIASNTCSGILLVPEASCAIGIEFAPTAAGTRTGNLQISSSASTTPVTVSLSGIGVTSQQILEFSPSSLVFPDQVIRFSSAAVNVYVYNAGPDPSTIDRVLVSGPYQVTATTCPQVTLQPKISPSQYQTCAITVVFSPIATGAQTGVITVVDTEGRQSAYSLAGNGVAQSASVLLDPDGLAFGTYPVGSTSGAQTVNVSNIGNVPVTVSAIATTGDFAVGHPYCNPPFTLAPGGSCGPLSVTFTPSKIASPDTGTLTVTTTAGARTASLNGVGVAATKSVLLTPATTNVIQFGTVQIGSTANVYPYSYALNIYNTGSDPVTFAAAPTIQGADAGDFSVAQNSCNAPISPQASCNIYLQFKPTAAGSRTAVLSVTDDASTGNGVQTISLAGTGTSTQPAYQLKPLTMTFAPQVMTTTSATQELVFTNYTAAPVTIATVTIQSALIARVQNYYGDCNEGAAAANGGTCSIGLAFTPTQAGGVSSTVTLKDSAGKTYVAQIYANGVVPGRAIAVSPAGLNFAPQPQGSTSAAQTFTLTNNSGTPTKLGQAAGSGVIVGTTTTGAFKVTSDGCSNLAFRSDYPNNSCAIAVVLTPAASTAVGAASGSITIPVTYRDNSAANISLTLAGTVVADIDSVELSPKALRFPDQAINLSPSTGGGDATQYVYLTNSSNLPIKIGSVTGTNTITHSNSTGQFTIWGLTSLPPGDACSGQTLQPGAKCGVQVAFVPTAAATGVAGSLSFPVTFSDGKTQTLGASYLGNALAAKSSLQITPGSANFGPVVMGEAGAGVVFNILNNGNQPVVLGTATLTSTQTGTNFTHNGYGYSQCGTGALAVGASCPVFVEFQPQSAGTITGLLTIGDGSASGGPHKIALTGVGLSTAQTITASQTTVAFGNRPVGLGGSAQALYLSNHSFANVGGATYTLSGTNASDFTLQANSCGATLLNRSDCALLVNFTPSKTSLGARTAVVSVKFTGTGSPINITLTGTGVADTPASTVFPASLSFPTTNVGSKSGALTFSVSNTGSAPLTISTLTVTNSAEFPLASDGCTGKTLAVGADCLVSVSFSPTLGGARSGSIAVADNASGSPQHVTLSGTGYGIPKALFTPSSAGFGNQTVGTTSAAKTVTLSNPGTDTLKISGIALTGGNPGDFKQTNTCTATLAPAASCTVTLTFSPTASGSRSTSLVVTGNMNNTAGSTLAAAVSGAGVP